MSDDGRIADGELAAAIEALRQDDDAMGTRNASIVLARLAAAEAIVDRLEDELEILPCYATDDQHAPHLVRLGITSRRPLLFVCPGVASPTPTGPEPAKCEHGETGAHSFYVAEGRDWDHSAEYATCPGPATPEPTEETP